MTDSLVSGQLILAQKTDKTSSPPTDLSQSNSVVWVSASMGLLILLVGVVAYARWRYLKISKQLKFEQYKGRDLKKKLKLALVTIRRMEMNPDLVYAREFNLDYLRMRMDEEVFHYVVLNQMKTKVKQFVGAIIRPDAASTPVGIVGSPRQIDSTFDVTYEVETQDGKWNKGVLFRVQIKLTKLPTQSSTTTISQLCECLEYFLSPGLNSSWQPSLQGQMVLLSWDQKAKPTPLLILEQIEEGLGVSVSSRHAFPA